MIIQELHKQWQPQQCNCDLSQRVVVDSREVTWYPTPYTGIWFHCFESDHLVQDHPLTMLTRFDPGGFFPDHGHPGGEEILVLQGTFADETGEYPPGSYSLNPESFTHTPYSAEGCITFVKLRQHGKIPEFGGKAAWQRQQIKTNIHGLIWQPGPIPQISFKLLYEQTGFPEKVQIERWQPGTQLSRVTPAKVTEIFVIEGTWADEMGTYSSGTWLRYPPNCSFTSASPDGCMLYVKTYPMPVVRFD